MAADAWCSTARCPALIAGTAPRIPQDLARGSLFRRPQARGRPHRLAPDRACAIHNLVRGVAPPYPGRVYDGHRRQDFAYTAHSTSTGAARRRRAAALCRCRRVLLPSLRRRHDCCSILELRTRRHARLRRTRTLRGRVRGARNRPHQSRDQHSTDHEKNPDPRRQRLHRPPPVPAHHRRPPTGRSTAWTCRPSASRTCSSTRAFTSSKATSRSTRNGSSTTSASATRCCRWSRSPRPRRTCKEPLRVFELDFEANLPIVRSCVKYRKRILFPSTSEVYGMCRDDEFDPENFRTGAGPDRQAALDLLVQQAADGPRDLGLRLRRQARLHAVPPVQLDRRRARQHPHAEGRQLARDHAVPRPHRARRERSSWSTAARRNARSPTSTTASTR